MSTEAVTPFADTNSEGLRALTPGAVKLSTDVSAELLIGQGLTNYKGAKFKFNVKINNPLPRYAAAGGSTPEGGGKIKIIA